jgi:hypothetical protein
MQGSIVSGINETDGPERQVPSKRYTLYETNTSWKMFAFATGASHSAGGLSGISHNVTTKRPRAMVKLARNWSDHVGHQQLNNSTTHEYLRNLSITTTFKALSCPECIQVRMMRLFACVRLLVATLMHKGSLCKPAKKLTVPVLEAVRSKMLLVSHATEAGLQQKEGSCLQHGKISSR